MAEDKLTLADHSLQRVQEFDLDALAREQELGQALNFKDALAPARLIVDLFKQFPRQYLQDLPPNERTSLTQIADSFFNQLNEILKFDPTQGNPYDRRTSIIDGIKSQYQSIFSQLMNLTAYGASRQRDFSRIEQEFRSSIQRASDQAAEQMKLLTTQQDEARQILETIRKTAAEQGVSQQAFYFNQESGLHSTESNTWRMRTFVAAGALGIYAFASMFLHKLVAPTTQYETIQIAISKVLIFAVLGYILILCARNFLAHKHNAIVNKHRQNALLTFKALVDAAGSPERQDVILTYAAACIFSPQDTGYVRGSDGSKSDMPMNIIQAIPKLVSKE